MGDRLKIAGPCETATNTESLGVPTSRVVEIIEYAEAWLSGLRAQEPKEYEST